MFIHLAAIIKRAHQQFTCNQHEIFSAAAECRQIIVLAMFLAHHSHARNINIASGDSKACDSQSFLLHTLQLNPENLYQMTPKSFFMTHHPRIDTNLHCAAPGARNNRLKQQIEHHSSHMHAHPTLAMHIQFLSH